MKRKFAEAMNELQESYIAEAMEPGKRHSRVLRIVALAACLAVMVTVGFGIWNFQSAQQPEVVLPPTRLGQYQTESELARSYTVQEGAQEATVIAWVRIGNWLGEDFSDGTLFGRTFFDLEVVKVFKGNPADNIVVVQQGSSVGTMRQYPLFTYGEEMILFLRESSNAPHENCYWIIGAYSTVLDVARDNDGNAYVIDGFYFLKKSMGDTMISNVENAEKRSQIFGNVEKMDPLANVDSYTQEWIILEIEDFESLLN